MRAAPNKSLQILEQAKFVVELLTIHGMSVADVAESLSRSKGWVCMRRNLLDEMSEEIQRILFRGTFPVYSYMYTLRPFMPLYGLYPENRPSPAPTGKAILECFSTVSIVIIKHRGTTNRRLGELNPIQQKLLRLMGIPPGALKTFKRRCGT